LGPLDFTSEEQEFARTIQRETGVEPKGLNTAIRNFEENPGLPEGGSTDVADVSWVMPTLQMSVTTAPANAPWHAWPVVACGGMSIGHKGMIYASKAMAATMVDLFRDPKQVAVIAKEFEEKTRGIEYVPYIPAGPPVPPPTN
ncbi:MAG: amidohydrolase, partial [Thermoanaerobaculia bacterium]